MITVLLMEGGVGLPLDDRDLRKKKGAANRPQVGWRKKIDISN